MATLANFMPHILPFVSGCPEPTAMLHLRVAIAEFCERTRCWTHQVRNLPASTSSRIAIPVPPGTAIVAIEKCWLDGRELYPLPLSTLSQSDLDEIGTPEFFTQARPGEVSLVPRGTGNLRLNVYVKPVETPSGKSTIAYSVYSPDVYEGVYTESTAEVSGTLVIPDFILEQWGSPISDGAVARIKMIPNQPWTDPSGAAAHAGNFERHVLANFGRNLRGQHRATRRQRASYF